MISTNVSLILHQKNATYAKQIILNLMMISVRQKFLNVKNKIKMEVVPSVKVVIYYSIIIMTVNASLLYKIVKPTTPTVVVLYVILITN